MIPYYILMGAPVLTAFLYALSQGKKNRLSTQKSNPHYPIVVFFFLYFLLLSLRSRNVGVDVPGYLRSFQKIAAFSWNEVFGYTHWETGYVLLNKVVSLFTRDPQIFLCITAIITILPTAILYYRESEDDVLAIALYFVFPAFLMNFSGIRQAIAMALAAPAFYLARDRKLIKFLLLVFLATQFHQSAIVLFLLYPVYHMNLRPKHLFLLIPGFIFTLLYNSRLFLFILPLLGSKYENYGTVVETGAYTMIILMSLFVAYAFVVPKEDLMDDTTRGLRNLLVLSLFIQLFTPISHITMRMNYYYVIFIPLLIPKITNRWKNIDKRYIQLIRIGMSAFFLLYHLRKMHTVDNLNIYPYKFFWRF